MPETAITVTWMQPSQCIIHAARMIVDPLD